MLVFTHEVYFNSVEHQLANKSHLCKLCSAFGSHLPSLQCYCQLLLYRFWNTLLLTSTGPGFPPGCLSAAPLNEVQCNWKVSNWMLIKPIYVVLLRWPVWRQTFSANANLSKIWLGSSRSISLLEWTGVLFSCYMFYLNRNNWSWLKKTYSYLIW